MRPATRDSEREPDDVDSESPLASARRAGRQPRIEVAPASRPAAPAVTTRAPQTPKAQQHRDATKHLERFHDLRRNVAVLASRIMRAGAVGSAPDVPPLYGTLDVDFGAIGGAVEAVTGLKPVIVPMHDAAVGLQYASLVDVEQGLSSERRTELGEAQRRFDQVGDHLAGIAPYSQAEFTVTMVAQRARHAAMLVRLVADSSTEPPVRVTALYMLASLTGKEPRPGFVQHETTVADATPRVREAVDSLAAPPAAPFVAKYGAAVGVPLPHTTDAAMRKAYAEHAARQMAQRGPDGEAMHRPEKAHAMDPQAMYEASPYNQAGKVDDATLRHLNGAVASLKERVAALRECPPDTERGAIGSAAAAARKLGHAPLVDGAQMVLRHLATADQCQHCAAGGCRILEIAALSEEGPMAFYPKQRPVPPAGGPRERTYPLSDEHEAKQVAAVAKLAASGRVEVIPTSAASYISPTFIAEKHRFAKSLEDVEHWWTTDKDDLERHLQEKMISIFGLGPVEVGKSPTAVAMMRKLESHMVSDGGRLVYDYTVVNEAGCSWPMTLCTAAEMLTYVTPGGFVASVDIESGFHHVGLHPADRRYFAFMSGGVCYQPTRLMFGKRQAPAHFSMMTAEVVRTAAAEVYASKDPRLGPKCGVRISVYIDDIFIFGPTHEACAAALALRTRYCEAVFIKLKEVKIRPPTQDAPLLGLRVNTVDMSVYIPADKRYNMLVLARFCLDSARARTPVPLEVLRKLTGKLVHMTSVFPEGLARMPALWEVAEPGSDYHDGDGVQLHRATAAVRALEFFDEVLRDASRAAARLIPTPASPAAQPWVYSYSDASGDIGFSGNVGPLALYGRWREGLGKHMIVAKEAYAPLLIASLVHPLLGDRVWSPRLDNAPLVFALLKGRTDDAHAAPLVMGVLALMAAKRESAIPGWNPRDFNQNHDDGSKATVTAAWRAVVTRYARFD